MPLEYYKASVSVRRHSERRNRFRYRSRSHEFLSDSSMGPISGCIETFDGTFSSFFSPADAGEALQIGR